MNVAGLIRLALAVSGLFSFALEQCVAPLVVRGGATNDTPAFRPTVCLTFHLAFVVVDQRRVGVGSKAKLLTYAAQQRRVNDQIERSLLVAQPHHVRPVR